jgi:hypothetical protein
VQGQAGVPQTLEDPVRRVPVSPHRPPAHRTTTTCRSLRGVLRQLASGMLVIAHDPNCLMHIRQPGAFTPPVRCERAAKSASEQASPMRTSPHQGGSWTSATTIAGAKAVTHDGMIGATKWGLPTACPISESKEEAPGEQDEPASPTRCRRPTTGRRVHPCGCAQTPRVGRAVIVRLMTDEIRPLGSDRAGRSRSQPGAWTAGGKA